MGFLLPRKGKISLKNEARFAQKARLMGYYSVLKITILRAETTKQQSEDCWWGVCMPYIINWRTDKKHVKYPKY